MYKELLEEYSELHDNAMELHNKEMINTETYNEINTKIIEQLMTDYCNIGNCDGE